MLEVALSEMKTLGSRARAVRLKFQMSQGQMAKTLGISLRSWQMMERDEGVPSGETLLRFESVGYNPGWILTGLGPEDLVAAIQHDLRRRHPVEAIKTSNQRIDDWTMRRLAAVVTGVHAERKLSISPENVAVEAALLYNELIGRVSDLSDRDEIEAVLPHVRYLLKKRLDEAEAEPGAGKASA